LFIGGGGGAPLKV